MLGVEEFDGAAVRDDVTLEAPLGAQDVGEKPPVRLDRDAVVIVVGCHHPEGAGVADGAAKWFQMEHLHFAPGGLRIGAGMAVTSAFRNAVNGEVLERGGDARLLQSAHLLDPERGGQEGILGVAFHHAAPAGIAGEVEHGRIEVGVAEGAAFAARDAADLPHEGGVPRAGDADLRRETGGAGVQEAADALVGEVHRDAEAGSFDEPALHFVDRAGVLRPGQVVVRVGEVVGPAGVAVDVLVDVADAVLPDGGVPGGRGQFVRQDARKAIERGELRGFLFDCHAAEQVGDAVLDGDRRILVGIAGAVLVQVDPTLVVEGGGGLRADEVARWRGRREGGKGKKQEQEFEPRRNAKGCEGGCE